ncbi:B12-binding domain-containing radical SAM protein [bacterium]|nr:B12-binding domain-containing radical SAM protein [bacterium]
MKILLVSSSVTKFGFDRVTRLPNLGLCSLVANYVNPDDEIRILDLVVAEKNPRQFFIDTVQNYQPDVIGFSCMIFQFHEIVDLANSVKQFNKNIIIILGGYYATIDYENIFDYRGCDAIDYILRNECEKSFYDLIDSINSGKGFDNLSGLSYRNKGQIIHNPCSNVLDIDDIQLPNRNARIIKKGFHFMGIPADVVETSRGCPNSCKFCCIRQMYGNTFRKFKIERVIADMQDVVSRGAKFILFADDNITIDGKRFIDLCDAIIETGLNRIQYAVQSSISGINKTPGLAEKMAKAGVKIVFLGIENIIPNNLTITGKTKQNSEDEITQVIAKLRNLGMITIGSFIFGNPDDNRDTIIANYEFANRINIDIPLFLILTPFPRYTNQG